VIKQGGRLDFLAHTQIDTDALGLLEGGHLDHACANQCALNMIQYESL
jgi:hypothetical protein